MSDSMYDSRPQLHPALKDLQARFFPFNDTMYPEDFAQQYQFCAVRLPSGWVQHVNITRYKSGWSSDFSNEKQAWSKHVKAYHGSGIDPALKDWLGTTRPTAAFSGHGLPEEISLICEQALKTAYKTPSTIGSWASTWLGLDCNGFVCFYFLKLGTFSRVLHKHPLYPNVTKLAKSVAEIDCDCVLLWAKNTSGKNWAVKNNPGEDGAHIAVVDSWYTRGSQLLVAERGGGNRFQDHVGIHVGVYDIVKAPKAGCSDAEAIWQIRSIDPIHGHAAGVENVLITRQMQSY
jgi:hypothetical protein